MHEEEFDRVFCVTEDGGFAVERAAVDLVAGVVGDEAAAFKSAFEGGAAGGNGELGQVGGVCAAVVDDAAVGTGLADADGGFAASQIGGQGDGDEVVRDAVDGEAGFACGFVIAEQDGLVVAGNGACGVAVVADLPRGECLAWKWWRGVCMAWAQTSCQPARFLSFSQPKRKDWRLLAKCWVFQCGSSWWDTTV